MPAVGSYQSKNYVEARREATELMKVIETASGLGGRSRSRAACCEVRREATELIKVSESASGWVP